MIDTYSQLKDELSVLYPGVTDAELTAITDRLVEFFTIGAKALCEVEKAANTENDFT